jgi:hypothetical protein
MKKHVAPCLLLAALLAGIAAPLEAQSTTLTIDSGTYTLKDFDNATPLAVGDVVEFGYYSSATVLNPFSGSFNALTGGTITNTAETPTADGSSFTTDTVSTVIGGDQNTGAGPGQFAYTLVFAPSTPNLPSNGQILAIKFFDNSTVASSGAYGAASNATWLWEGTTSSLDFPADYSLGDPGTLWLNNDTAFTGVPEPQTAVLVPVGLLMLYFGRRRLTVHGM